MQILDVQDDIRSGCISVLANMSLREYKKIVGSSFEAKGNLPGQRGVISRSASAAKIKKRMANDFNAGAIFPQVVIGVLTEKKLLKEQLNEDLFEKGFLEQHELSIIDGMQRSGIYFSNYEGNEDRVIRVEFWIADQSVKLLYRMMVLNTGQVPWNTRRQIEVIYKGLADNIIEQLYNRAPELIGKVDIMGVDDEKRRRQPGKYKKSAIIESYLGFCTRRVKVNLSDELANEFQRFDMMEVLEQGKNFEYFVESLIMLCKLDFAFSEFTEEEDLEKEVRFKSGKDIFTSIPASLGFMVACGEFILGKTSIIRDDETKETKYNTLKLNMQKILDKLDKEKNNNQAFLALESLNEIITGVSKNRIGDEERTLFKNAFYEMIRDEDFEEMYSLDAYWRE